MKILNVKQGSTEWLAARANFNCASEASAMMGASKHTTRTDLLKRKALGIVEDIDPATQRLFDAGHAAEAGARPVVEGLIGEELYPATGTLNGLLASFDGLTMDGLTGFEHKLWNESLAAQVRAKELEPHYYWQLEHQIVVGGLEKIVFVCSDGTPSKFVQMVYRPVPGRQEQLLAGWAQFDLDREAYKHVEVIPAAVAAPIEDLPALSIQVNGSISLIDNLEVFGAKLAEFIDGLDKNPSDDQAFADADAAIKTLEKAQKALEAAEASALAQTASIDSMRRTVGLYKEQARTTRLALEKLVKARKETLRAEIVQAGKDALHDHTVALNKRLGKALMPQIAADFAGAVKGKKSIASLRDAVDTELAHRKIEANAIADRIQINLTTLAEAKGHEFLFHDLAQIVQKENDDFSALVKVRIAEHDAAETKRIEADRERIRKEEEARILREQAEKERVTRTPEPKATWTVTTTERPAGPMIQPQTYPPSREELVECVASEYGVSKERAHGWLAAAFEKQAA